MDATDKTLKQKFRVLIGRSADVDKLHDKVDSIEFDGAGTRAETEALAFLRGHAEALDVTLGELFDVVYFEGKGVFDNDRAARAKTAGLRGYRALVVETTGCTVEDAPLVEQVMRDAVGGTLDGLDKRAFAVAAKRAAKDLNEWKRDEPDLVLAMRAQVRP